MNVTLKEWNELIVCGNDICNELKDRGLNVKLKPYEMYNGNKGLSFQVLDIMGNVFNTYQSGTSDFQTMKRTLCQNGRKIVYDNF